MIYLLDIPNLPNSKLEELHNILDDAEAKGLIKESFDIDNMHTSELNEMVAEHKIDFQCDCVTAKEMSLEGSWRTMI